jgi:hypothetical protein
MRKRWSKREVRGRDREGGIGYEQCGREGKSMRRMEKQFKEEAQRQKEPFI